MDQFVKNQIARVVEPSGESDIKVYFKVGMSVHEIIEQLPEESRATARVYANGQDVTEVEGFSTALGDNLLVTLVPASKESFRLLLTIGATLAIGPAGLGLGATAAGAMGITSTLGVAAVTAGLTFVSSMAINALIPPAKVGANTQEASNPSYSLTGQSNQTNKYGTVPKLYGTMKMFPTVASNTLVKNVGTSSIITTLYDFGLGDVAVDVNTLLIGETAASEFSPTLKMSYNTKTPTLEKLSNKVGYEQYSRELKHGEAFTTATKIDTNSFTADISFPQGLVTYDSKGKKQTATVQMQVKFRVQGSTGPWEFIRAKHCFGGNGVSIKEESTETFTVGAATGTPFVLSISVDGLSPSQYEIFFMRTSLDFTSTNDLGKTGLTLLKSYSKGEILSLKYKHTMLEMTLEATGKINGQVNTLSAICTSVLRTTTDGVTFTNKATDNPAWICIDILTGDANSYPLKDDQIDWDSWIALADYCDTKGYTCSFVQSTATTVQQLLNSVLSASRASGLWTSAGKYGVLIDQAKEIPRQLITPSNSWGYTSDRSYSPVPHALRVTFINPSNAWQQDEIICYNDGYSETNATRFENLETFGITDGDQAWKYGRYMLAQGIHRSETFTVTMDIESFTLQRGDLVQLAHYVPAIGGTEARISKINTTSKQVQIDRTLSSTPTGYCIRRQDGTIFQHQVLSVTGGNIIGLNTVTGMNPGDLIVFGNSTQVVEPMIVQSISRSGDMQATIKMTKYVPGVYTADVGAIPEWQTGFGGSDMVNKTDLVNTPVNLTTAEEVKITYIDRQPNVQITLKWTTAGVNYAKSKIYMTVPGGVKQKLVGESTGYQFIHNIDPLSDLDLLNKSIGFNIVPYSEAGLEGTGCNINITPTPNTEPPSAVKNLAVNLQGQTLSMRWDTPTDTDIDYYLVRFYPSNIASDAEWECSQHLARLDYTSTSFSFGARIGTYMIRVVDTSGNVSDIIKYRTPISHIQGLTAEVTVDDSDNTPVKWNGNVSAGASKVGNFVLGKPKSVEYYYFADVTDLGSVYTCRIQDMNTACGIDSRITGANNITTDPTLFSVSLEARTSRSSHFMKSWTNLADLDNLKEELDSDWSGWRPVVVTDFVARLVQFRFVMTSFSEFITPRLETGRVDIDLPDRTYAAVQKAVATATAKKVTVSGITTVKYTNTTRLWFRNAEDKVAAFAWNPAVTLTSSNPNAVPVVLKKTAAYADVVLIDHQTGNPTFGTVDLIASGVGETTSYIDYGGYLDDSSTPVSNDDADADDGSTDGTADGDADGDGVGDSADGGDSAGAGDGDGDGVGDSADGDSGNDGATGDTADGSTDGDSGSGSTSGDATSGDGDGTGDAGTGNSGDGDGDGVGDSGGGDSGGDGGGTGGDGGGTGGDGGGAGP